MPVNDPDHFEEQTTSTIAEAFDVMVTASGSVHRNAIFLSKVVRPLMWLVTAMVVVMVLQQLSLVNRDKKVEDLQKTVIKLDGDVKMLEQATRSTQDSAASAQLSSEAAKAALDEAIAQSQRGGVSPEVAAALTRINDIYTTCVQEKACGK